MTEHVGLVVALHAGDRGTGLLGRHHVGLDHPGAGRGSADAADRCPAIAAAIRLGGRHPVGHHLLHRLRRRLADGDRLAGGDGSADRRLLVAPLPLAGEHGSLGRMGPVIVADPLEDGAGQLILIAGGGQQLLFGVVGDKARLHQHGGDIRRLQHRQTGVLRCLLVQPGHPTQRAQDLAADVITLGAGLVHGEVEEGLRQIGVRVRFGQHLADAPQQLALLLLFLQPAAHLAVGAVGRQYPDGGTTRGRVVEAVGVHRHQQVGLGLAGNLGALVQVDEVVTAPGQHGTHAGLAVDEGGQLLGDRQGHPLLVGATRADGARVFTAVARVDGDHHSLALTPHRRGLHRGGGLLFVRQVDHQAVAVGSRRRQREHHRLDGGAEIQHQPQTALLQRRALADLAHQLALVLDAGQIGDVARPFQVDHQPVGAGQGEIVVIGGTAHVEHHPGVVRRRPHPHALELIRPGG